MPSLVKFVSFDLFSLSDSLAILAEVLLNIAPAPCTSCSLFTFGVCS